MEFKLIIKKINATLTPEEELVFNAWYNESDANRDYFMRVKNNFEIDIDDVDLDLAWNAVNKKITPKKNKKSYFKYAIAASVALLLGTGIFYYTKPKQQIIQIAAKPQEIAPGGTKGILTLSNGKQIILSNISKKDTIAKEGEEVTIKMDENGVITYVINPDFKDSKEDPNAFNTLSTPTGGQYNIVLADGTKVYLNTVSSIKYPTQFNGNQRIVELEGEAYFEVAKNKNKPFIVKSGDQSIEVLGTHFNVHAYNNESIVKTTLLEGSVSVSYKNQKSILKPGQQSNVSESFTKIKIKEVDTEAAVAWKNGRFKFDNADLKSVMKQLERWYGIKVEYRGDVSDIRFNGGTFMNKNLSEVLKVLELSDIKFKVEGKTIIVYP